MTPKPTNARPLRIREGGIYVDWNGNEQGPMTRSATGAPFPWRAKNTDRIFTETGGFFASEASRLDLISEANHTPAKRSARWVVEVQCASRSDAHALQTHIKALHDEDRTLKAGAVRVVRK